MKVILLQDVARIGRRHDIKDVPDGHALNFLIPRKLAERASARSTKRVDALKANQTVSHESQNTLIKNVLTELKSHTPPLTIEANEQGHLFRGIHTADIALHFKENGIQLDESLIHLEAPIKEIGTHTLHIGNTDVSDTVHLDIVKK